MTESPAEPPHQTADEFRRNGYAVIDWIANYMENVERYPVLSTCEPGAVRERLPEAPPEHGESFERVLADIDDIIVPGLTHWQSPNFFAFFPAGSSGPAILGDLLSSGLCVQGMLWATSPACTELESHVLDWLVDMLGLPMSFSSSRSTSNGGGVIQDTASSSSLCALLAARERATAYRAGVDGVPADLCVYTSSQAHSSIEKAVMVAGTGTTRLRKIDVDADHRMRVDRLRHAIESDMAVGLCPAFVCATVGTTSSGAVDPIADIAELCREHQIWLHVDGAMLGTAALCPEYRDRQRGLDGADSYTFNPHKWMLTNFDCSCLFVKDREPLIRALSILPEYLRNRATQSGAVIDYRDWHIPLGRRFRALKLWFVIRHYGVEGLRAHVRATVARAERFAHWVEEEPDFELAAAPSLVVVCFRWRRSDADNERLLDALNASGALYLTHTKLEGRFVLRLALGVASTRDEHVAAAWQRIIATARSLEPE